jgi:hypothetical protein
VRHFTGVIRLVVVHELPQEDHNALLHLFSARADLLRYGATHYRVRSEETSTLLVQLFDRYRLEGALMPDLLEQLARETIEELLKELPVEKRLKGLPPEERLKGLSAEERLKGLSVDDLLAALSPETRAALAQRLKDQGSHSSPGGT